LTTNRIKLHAIYPVGDALDGDEAELRRILGHYAASTPGGNRTMGAIKEAFDGQARHVEEEIPFSSERKWSALAFDDPTLRGAYVLGAPEVLSSHLQFEAELGSQINEWANQGLRVLLFAYRPHNSSLYDAEGKPQLPSGLIPLSLLSFSDELRPEAEETLRHFAELGIEPKIISGDNPHTVAALSRQVGFARDVRVVSGLDLDAMPQVQLEELAEEATIFGRITPHQKEKLVRLFRSKGHYVGMIGDGVNDVLSLKQAHVGIAMESGSPATRGVADMVLLGDSFAALPVAFREGQRIIKGMEDVVRLLLTRTFSVLFLIIATQIVGVAFPVTPKHNSILALVTVGIPILAIAAWARPGAPPRSVIRSASRFVFPAAFTVSVVALAVYLSYLGRTGDVEIARTALTTAMVMCGLVLIPFVEPPAKAWTGGDVLSGDWRPTVLALGMLGLYGMIMAVPSLRTFFELTPLRGFDYLLIGIVVAGWALLLRLIWRGRLLERLLDVKVR
jgi:cation-transporting ATPase E